MNNETTQSFDQPLDFEVLRLWFKCCVCTCNIKVIYDNVGYLYNSKVYIVTALQNYHVYNTLDIQIFPFILILVNKYDAKIIE